MISSKGGRDGTTSRSSVPARSTEPRKAALPKAPTPAELRRFRAIDALATGFTQSQVATLLGTSRTSVSKWVTRFEAEGRDGLLERRRGRPPARQVAGREAELRALLLTCAPEQLGVQGALWSWRTVQALLARLGISASRWSVMRYLAEWGIRAPRPLEALEAGAPAAVHRWFAETYPALKARARATRALVAFVERTQVASRWGGGEGAARRDVLDMAWAVGGRGESAFLGAPRPHDDAATIDLLERLLRHAGSPLVIVTSEQVIGEGARLRAWLEARRDIRLEFVRA